MLRLDFYKRAIRSIHPLCSLRSTPTWPFDVKPPTYEPIGLIPTCEPQARTDYERQLIFICLYEGKYKDVTNTPLIKIFRFPTQISILISQICLFSSSLAYSILASVFSSRHKKTRLSIFSESLVFLSLCRWAKRICPSNLLPVC